MGAFLKKPKVELPYDLAILLLGIYAEKIIIWKDTCTPMFITALFTIAKTWKQPKCPSTDAWIKIWYIHTMKYYAAIKKNEVMPFPIKWTDLEIIILSEISQTKINIIWYLYVEFKKWYIWTYLQNRNKFTDLENKLMVIKGERWGGGIN